jgi:hypothetical protein
VQHKAVGVDVMAGTGTMAGRVTLQNAATAMRAQDQAKANAGTLAEQLSSEKSKGLQSISQNFRKGGPVLATSLPIAATPNRAASEALNAKPSGSGLRQKCPQKPMQPAKKFPSGGSTGVTAPMLGT